MATGAAVISAVALGAQFVATQKAEDKTEEANEAQQRSASLKNARARRQQVAAARRARAATVAQGEAGGISGSSAVAGATGSVQSQASSNIGFLNQLETLDRQRLSAQNAASRNLTRASTFQAVGGLAQSGAGREGLEKL